MASGFEERAWLARVSTPSGVIAGAGFALDGAHVVTCAHVVAHAGGNGPGANVRVEFPLLGGAAQPRF